MGLSTKGMLCLLAVVVLTPVAGWMGWSAFRQTRQSMEAPAAPTPNDSDRDVSSGTATVLGQVLQVDMDGECLKGNGVFVSVKASRIACDLNGQCGSYEQKIPLKNNGANIPIYLTEIRKSLNTSWKNLIVSVSVCDGVAGNKNCEDHPRYQALKMSGRYIEAANFGDVLNLQLLANKHSSGTCNGT